MFASVKTVGLLQPFWLMMSYTPTTGPQYREISTQIGEIFLVSSNRDAAIPAPLHDGSQCTHKPAHLQLVENHGATRRHTSPERDEALPVERAHTAISPFRLSERLIFVSSGNRPKSRAALAKAPGRSALTARPKRAAPKRSSKASGGKKVAKRYVRLAKAG